jgi:lipoprotein signal peptidase
MMAPWVYLMVFVVVIGADQLSKQWAIRRLSAVGVAGARLGFGWILTRSPAFEWLGGTGAALLWLIAGAAGAALCLVAPGGAVAAIGGIAAWGAAASNLGEWWRRGTVVDWVRLWPRSLTNLADAVLIVGTAQLVFWVVAA